MARGDYAWYGDWMDDHYQPWIDHQKRTSDAWDSYMKASDHAQNYLGGRTVGSQAEFEEAKRRYDASDAASAKWNALLEQGASFNEGAKTAFDAWSNFKPESEPEPTKPDFPYSGLLEPVESKDTGGGFIKNEDTGEVTNIGESKYHRIINEDGTGTIFPITDTTWSDFYQPAEEPIGDTTAPVEEEAPSTRTTSTPADHFLPSDPNSRYKTWDDWREQVPITEEYLARGREPNPDDRPYKGAPKPGDPDYTPPPSFQGQDIPTKIADAGIPRTADWTGEGRPAAPESGMKWYPTNNPNDPGGGFWSPDLNHEKWKVENLGGEIGQIASSESLQPGMIPSLEDNIARDTKQQRLAQETGTAIRQLETDQRSSEPTLAERLAGLDQTIADNTYTTGDKIRDFVTESISNAKEVRKSIPSLSSNIPGLPTGIGSNFIKTANDYLNIGSTAEKSKWGLIDMVKDEIDQAQRTGGAGKGGWNPVRGMPGYGTAKKLLTGQDNPGGFGSGPTEAGRRFFKTGGRLAKGAANLGVGIAADWAADKFLMPHVEKAGQRMGKSLKNWANEFDAKRNNKAMSGKSIGNIGGRKLYNLPSFNQF